MKINWNKWREISTGENKTDHNKYLMVKDKS